MAVVARGKTMNATLPPWSLAASRTSATRSRPSSPIRGFDPDYGELFNSDIDYSPRTTLTPYRLHREAMTRLAPATLPHSPGSASRSLSGRSIP